MQGSYLEQDVTILLKDITGLVEPLPASEREKLIQSGTHYCEMLPLEYKPSNTYMKAYQFSLQAFSKQTADAVCQVAEKIAAKAQDEIVLVSLARAGIPIGILIKRYLEKKYQKPVFHYAISIIRDKGIDKNAVNTILSSHSPKSIQFVDGWIGKGAIQRELAAAMMEVPEVSSKLAVLSDPANLTELCGTHEDILIPSSCLNCTVSGLLSRTFLRNDLILENDFHGAAYYKELESEDLSYAFIEAIEQHFDYDTKIQPTIPTAPSGLSEVQAIARHFSIDNINLIKPGIGEATRVLLRRFPWKLLLKPGYKSDPLLAHLIQLGKEKNVPIEEYPLQNYKACGIIKKIADT